MAEERSDGGTPATIAIESDPLTSPRCGKRKSTATSAATSQARKSSSETSWCTVTAIADRVVGDRGRRCRCRDAAPDDHRVHVGRQRAGMASTSAGEALGFIDVSGRDHHGASPYRP